METANNNPLLVARGICRNFETAEGTLKVLQGINLDVAFGEMVAVIGESGVGKSTLMHILGGLDRPTSGSVRIKDEEFGSKTESDLARFRNHNVGFIFQQHHLLEDFTALENVMMPSLIAGRTMAEATSDAEQLLADVGLSSRIRHRPRQLSGGEQQRVAVARALVNNPAIVIADEPSGNLDIKNGERLHSLLSDLSQKRGITFLIATHNKDLAGSCRRIVKLENGLLSGVEKDWE
nr:ABC transporter ATP-binding protein [candidate division Zixibacteria bacterium]